VGGADPGAAATTEELIQPRQVRTMDGQKSSDEAPVAVNGAFCVWLMGLSASGKTTLAQMLARALTQRGFTVEVLDGDIVRTTLSKGLGFSHGDRVTNLRRIAARAQDLVRQRVVTIVAAICPYHAIREEVRALIGEYVEVYLNCPLEVCISRDPKGLYRKALAGEIQHFTGIDDVFEAPVRPDIEVTTGAEAPEASLARILSRLAALRHIAPEAAAPREPGRAEAAPL
jgi:adenylyl-sulfate kinase